MALNRIQKTFVRLAINNKYLPFGSYKNKRSKTKAFPVKRVSVEVIDAVTGQSTSAKAFEESPAKFRKWLKLRNVRAEFTDVVLKKNSVWFKLADVEFIDYPIIIRVGSYKGPYLIKRIQDRKTKNGKTTCTIQLETVGNVDYLSILSAKKELLASKKGKK